MFTINLDEKIDSVSINYLNTSIILYKTMENIFYRVLLNDRIKIEPKYLSKDYRNYLLTRLKDMLEGICSKHGYIKEGSIEIYKVAPGNIELIGLNGSVVFDVYYYADICNPLIGNVLKATVTNVNKFGILAESASILEIIIAKNSVNITHDSGVDLERVQIGHQIMVEVIGKKFELNDKKISIVGKIVSGASTSSTKPKKVIKEDRVDDEDDVDDIDVAAADVIADGEDEEDKEKDDDETSLNENENEDEDEEFQKGGNEFFDSDEDQDEEEYEFYSEEEFDEEGDVDGDVDDD